MPKPGLTRKQKSQRVQELRKDTEDAISEKDDVYEMDSTVDYDKLRRNAMSSFKYAISQLLLMLMVCYQILLCGGRV